MCDARDLGVSVGENIEQESEVRSLKSEERGMRGRADAEASTPDRIPNSESRTPGIFEPNIYLYDRYPGGVGLSEPLFRLSETLLESTRKLIANCPCSAGCPSCVGPVGEVGERGKEVALAILQTVLGNF